MGLLTIEWRPIELLRAGDYAAAVTELDDLWPGLGVKPSRNGQTDREYGLLLLACGLLSIRLGRAEQARSFEIAKDMLSESARLFTGEPEECAARLALGSAYSDAGEYREALAVADSVLEMEADSEVAFGAHVLKAAALKHQKSFSEAWSSLEAAKPLAAAVLPIARGNFYVERGTLQRRLGNLNEAIEEYDQAEQCFLNARSLWHAAIVLNNLAGIYTDQEKFNLAHNSAGRAVALFRQSKDKAFEAKALDQTARIYLAQNKPAEAEPIARRAVTLLESGDNASWLAEALITHGKALMIMGTDLAKRQIERASEICNRIADHQQDAEAQEALSAIFKQSRSMRELLKSFEPSIIRYALRCYGNRIPPAAKLLGITRQALEDKVSKMADITPTKRRRRKSLFRNRGC